MSAIARFLVEFELSPSLSPADPLSTPFASLDHATAIEGLDDVFGLASEPETGDFAPDGAFGVAATEIAPHEPSSADTSVAEAVAAAVATAEAGFSERIAALEEEHARARAEDRARWVRAEGSTLAEGFRTATAAIEEHIGEAVAAVLEPLVAGVLKGAALRELRQTIATLAASGSSAKLEVTGPEDLVEAVRAAIDADGGDTSGMTFTPSEEAEVTVTADNSTIRTRLAEWAVCFESSLGSDV